jgi:hypothetical protein
LNRKWVQSDKRKGTTNVLLLRFEYIEETIQVMGLWKLQTERRNPALKCFSTVCCA